MKRAHRNALAVWAVPTIFAAGVVCGSIGYDTAAIILCIVVPMVFFVVGGLLILWRG